jgi:protein-tyrosine phosphatase
MCIRDRAEVGAARHHAPLTSRNRAAVDAPVAATSSDRSPDTMVEQYLGILETSSELIVNSIGALAAPDSLPAVFFCAAGKDRTGVLSAVLLGALDVRDEDIVEDYVMSAESIDRVIGRFAATEGAPAMYRDLPPSHFAPVTETMERVLAQVYETYGSFGGYLDAKGLPSGTLATLKQSLLTAN